MTPEPIASAVLALCAAQGLALWLGVAGKGRLADWLALGCPAALLLLTLVRMPPPHAWQPLEAAFVLFNATAVGWALLHLWRGAATGAALRWSLWLVNSLSCAVMVYLAFVFRLF